MSSATGRAVAGALGRSEMRAQQIDDQALLLDPLERTEDLATGGLGRRHQAGRGGRQQHVRSKGRIGLLYRPFEQAHPRRSQAVEVARTHSQQEFDLVANFTRCVVQCCGDAVGADKSRERRAAAIRQQWLGQVKQRREPLIPGFGRAVGAQIMDALRILVIEDGERIARELNQRVVVLFTEAAARNSQNECA
jgi:hypothetical protein